MLVFLLFLSTSTPETDHMIMNIRFLYEDGKGSVVDKYGMPKPVDYIVDEEQFRLGTLSSTASGERERDWGNAGRKGSDKAS